MAGKYNQRDWQTNNNNNNGSNNNNNNNNNTPWKWEKQLFFQQRLFNTSLQQILPPPPAPSSFFPSNFNDIYKKNRIINFILKEQNPLRTTILLEKFSKRGGEGGPFEIKVGRSNYSIIFKNPLPPPPLFSQRSNRRPSNRRGCSNLHCHNEGSRLQRFPLTPPSHLRVLSRAPLQKAQTSSR